MKGAPTILLSVILSTVMGHAAANGRGSSFKGQNADAAAGRCQALGSTDLSQIKDAPVHIVATRLGNHADGVPRHCEVKGYVLPNVGFLLRLPIDNWNGKFLQLGCGGSCGTTSGATGDYSQCMDSASRGYACILSDSGHNGSGYLWAYNNLEAELDQAFRGAHVTAVAGKAIVEWFYGEPPGKAYFWGYSNGGRQALVEAQRFPWDFDGIIAGCPSINSPEIQMTALWNHRALVSAGKPNLGREQIETLHRAVVNHCDLNDGVKDGLIGDPRTCTFDPAQLLCSAKNNKACLTPRQLAVVGKVYDGPTASNKQKIFFSGPMKGSEKSWLRLFADAQFARSIEDVFRYRGFDPDPGPTWRIGEFDFDRDYKRIEVSAGLYSATNPDLRRFKAAGGKLIAFVGWNDASGMPLPVVDYYETAERAMGGRNATQDFFRLFAVPGMEHCISGDGPYAVDWMSAIEMWVEDGKPPDRLLGLHVQLDDPPDLDKARLLKFPVDPAKVEFSRPLYPYPVTTRYLGRGDPNDAANFGPAEP